MRLIFLLSSSSSLCNFLGLLDKAYDILEAYTTALKKGDAAGRRAALDSLDESIVRAVRCVQRFCPEMVCVSEELTLRVLTNGVRGGPQTTKCRRHHERRGDKTIDTRASYTGSANLTGNLLDGFLHCGCCKIISQKDMIMWKLASALSDNPDLQDRRHYFKDNHIFDRRTRAILFGFLDHFTGGMSLQEQYASNFFLKTFPRQAAEEDVLRRGPAFEGIGL